MPISSHKLKILVSACLLGHPVRYDGKGKLLDHKILRAWENEQRIVSVCPEMAAGFLTPRAPCEIEQGSTGEDVIDGRASIIDENGKNETSLFILGAEIALKMAQEYNCKYALLTENSPSCGNNFIYDGTFSSRKTSGNGVVAALLKRNGISVFNETEITDLAKIINQ